MKRIWSTSIVLGIVGALGLGGVAETASMEFVYPTKGQTPEKQKQDEAACGTWAIEQSGFDPAKPAPAPAPVAAPVAAAPPAQPTQPSGARLRGAAVAATVAAVADKDVGDAAVAGAVGGAAAQRGAKRQSAKAQQQATAQQQQAAAQQQQAATQQAAALQQEGQANYQKARGVCLEGRGYTVK